ncbi:BON domain-containing protein [Izhakiella capsodis]|uniref:BON domain-containing protein n=1 Tax=Izhakiella capsodis TaxID=1367852 RepID=A0A1I4V253_9GAMM|nr:BON domain-containing protein [Izhakiella capsodis]SFM95299.1 BON domain-containing protein [Izhakiella capsodis]
MKWSKSLGGLFAAMMMALTLSACAPTEHKEGTGGYIDDTVITTKVKSQLFGDEQLKNTNQISVETFKGRVQLSGFVASPQMAERAVSVARRVAGVKSVINDMQIR